MGEQKASVVPGALWVSPAGPATSTSRAGDPGGASVVRPAAVLAGWKGGDWFVRGRNWCSLLSGQASSVLREGSGWKGVYHAPFISLFGTVLVAGCSR